MQGGYQSSLQMSANGNVLKHECNFCNDTMKMNRLSCNGLSQSIKYGCTIINQQAKSKHGLETHIITQDQKIQEGAFCSQNAVHGGLGL